MNFINNFQEILLIISSFLISSAFLKGKNLDYLHETDPPIECPKGEEADCVKLNCEAKEPTCQIPEPICPFYLKTFCNFSCQCIEGLVRNDKQKCVKLSEYWESGASSDKNKCAENEEFKKCGNACESTCLKPNPGNCDKNCEDRCFCKDSYLRNKKGKCVKPSQCKEENQMQCGENEEFEECGTKCEPTCEKPFPKGCEDWCQRKCFCKSQYLRDKRNKCVKPRKCRYLIDDDDRNG